MKTFKTTVISSVMMASALLATAAEGVQVDHLGVNNTMVRTDGGSPLPSPPGSGGQ